MDGNSGHDDPLQSSSPIMSLSPPSHRLSLIPQPSPQLLENIPNNRRYNLRPRRPYMNVNRNELPASTTHRMLKRSRRNYFRRLRDWNTVTGPSHASEANATTEQIQPEVIYEVDGEEGINIDLNNEGRSLSPLLNIRSPEIHLCLNVPDMPELNTYAIQGSPSQKYIGNLPVHIPRAIARNVSAFEVTSRLIHQAREHVLIDERELQCPNCYMLPRFPVTGKCGHTRCFECTENTAMCPCGIVSQWRLHVNMVIQDLIQNVLVTERDLRASVAQGNADNKAINNNATRPVDAEVTGILEVTSSRMPITLQARFNYARKLLAEGRFSEAAPHLARVAASCAERARDAASLLTQVIEELIIKHNNAEIVNRELNEAIMLQSTLSWLRPSDLECVLCLDTFSRPVTTPCGHVYCRSCLRQSLYYRDTCALCKRPLLGLDLAATGETKIVFTALMAIGAVRPPLPLDPNVIPIFVCTVTFPGMPCPLLIFDPHCWLMIRRLLDSDSRRFGMVTRARDGSYSDYGTILEVRDCICREDGCAILSTIGLSRFKVVERRYSDGCDIARIEPVTDTFKSNDVMIWDLRLLAAQISYKAALWINSMGADLRSKIETAFGHMPFVDIDGDWWHSKDGPSWLWWLATILPLKSDIKVLILATDSLLKRMMTVSRTLDIVLQMANSERKSLNVPDRENEVNHQWLQQNL